MRIATRLILILSVLMAAIMVVYAVVVQRQREHLMRGVLIGETATLGQVLQFGADDALRDGRQDDLDRLLRGAQEDSGTYAAAVFDPEGRIVAGGFKNSGACLQQVLEGRMPLTRPDSGWAECEAPIRWVALPVGTAGEMLFVARYVKAVEQEIAISRLRHLLLALLLILTTTLVIQLVLRRTLSTPLATLMRGVHALGQEGTPAPIRVPAATGELGHVAAAFNHLAGQLEARRLSLLREAEERVALERRLREAQKYALLGRLAGGLAHELGSPLNVIGVRAEAVLDSGKASPEVRRQAEEILAEVERIAQLVRGLLHIARRHGIERHPVDLAEVAQGVAEQVGRYPEARRMQLELDLPPRPVIVHGQRTLLRHALLNLTRNAVQAMAEHEGERRLRIAVEPDADRVQVVVDDTGPGIPAEHLEQVFEPFFTTKDVGEGTGLGLPISRGIAEEHGGTLQLETREAGGVRAILTLPVAGPDMPGGEA